MARQNDACGHLDRPHGARGMCQRCYDRTPERRAQQAERYRADPGRKARDAEHYRANRAAILAQKAGYYQANKERIAAKSAERRREKVNGG